MKRRFARLLAVTALLAACGGDDGVSTRDLFEESLKICRVDDYSQRVDGLGAVYYTIIGRDQNDCQIEMVLINSPNAAWIDQPLRIRLQEDRSPAALQATIAACIEGRAPQVNDGSCAGALMDVLRQTRAGARPALAEGPFAQSGCGVPYDGPAPALLRMRSSETGLWGYINPEGTWVIAPRYKQAMAFSEGLAAVLEGDVWQVIDTAGSAALRNLGKAREQSYTSIYGENVYSSPIKAFAEGCARFSDASGKFYLSRDGKLWLQEATAQMAAAAEGAGGTVVDIEPFGAGLAGFRIDVETFGKLDPQGYIDAAGAVAIAPQFAQVGPFDAGTGLAPVGVARGPDSVFANGWIYINTFGRKVLPKGSERYKNAQSFSDGFAAVRVDRKYQYINSDGDYLGEDVFNVAQPFSDGMAYVRSRDDRHGWIDNTGKRVFTASQIGLCDSSWPLANPFEHGLALVIVAKDGTDCGQGGAVTLGGGASTFKNGEFAYVTKSGEIVLRESGLSLP